MEFNSFEFLTFFILIFFALWALRNKTTLYNLLLLVTSYTFYGIWDYRFLGLIFISSCIDFVVGYYIPKSKFKGILISISVIMNLGLLMFFKYFNFFIVAANDLLMGFGFQSSYNTLSIILPVGISFYTFQTLSYSIDIYKGKIKPTSDFLVFLNFVSFFPQLVAGPIERASSFLPQFQEKKVFEYENAVLGMRLLLYGLFKKIVLADNAATVVDPVFDNPEGYDDLSLICAGILFFIQLYLDFSAYTDIARGTAALLGFRLMENFKYPLFAKNIPEFWSRWHVSLTNWFRDYLYIWLVKQNKESTIWRISATIIQFTIIGFWHGANYTYLVFGIFNGIYFIPKLLSKNSKKLRERLGYFRNHKIYGYVMIMGTFSIMWFTTICFRSDNVQKAYIYYSHMFCISSFSVSWGMAQIFFFCVLFMVYEWIMKENNHPFDIAGFHPFLRKAMYAAMIVLILFYGQFGTKAFYYFQF